MLPPQAVTRSAASVLSANANEVFPGESMLSPDLFDRCVIHIFDYLLLAFSSPLISKNKCIFHCRIRRNSPAGKAVVTLPGIRRDTTTGADLGDNLQQQS
jgi:hypothetical protein